jgi:hypothetical protein
MQLLLIGNSATAQTSFGNDMNIYWDISNQRFVKSLNSDVEVTGLSFVLRDAVPVSLYLVSEQSNIITPYTVTKITSGHSVKFGAKLALTDKTYLIEQDTWMPAGTGATQRYEASLPLNGAALISAMAGLNQLALFAEFTTQDYNGKQYLSTKLSLTVVPDVIQGTETP